MNQINIALVGGWHVHAEGYGKELKALPGVNLCCVWDDDKERGRALAEKLGVPFVTSLQLVLDDPDVKGVLICTATNQHPEVITRAIRAGKHVFTEKVLTIHPKDAEAIAKELAEAGLCLGISFPHLGRPTILKAKELVDAGRLGGIHYARVRNVHDGAVAGWLPPHFYDRAACGGGAMIDLGAHPMYTLCHFLGEPESARSMFTKVTGKAVEDNAATLLAFKGGAIGLSETGFVSRHNPYTLELSGDKGYLMIQGDRLYLADKESEGKLVEVTDLPEALPSPLQRWVGALRMPKPGKVDLHDIGIGPALRLTRVMALAYGNAE